MEEGHGYGPVSHGAAGILVRDLLEGGVCGRVGEGVEERDAAIEVGLDGGRAGDRETDAAKLFGNAVIVAFLR